MPFATVNDVTLHYDYRPVPGREILILSNALGATLDMWENQLPLQGHFSLLRYDARGQGRSTSPSGPYGLATLAQDTLALMDALAIKRAHFCGVSLGGAVGQWIAAHAPERLYRLVLANTAAAFGDANRWDNHISKVQQKGMNSIADELVAKWLTASYRHEYKAESDRCRSMVTSNNLLGYLGACEALRDTNLVADTSNIAAETLVIYGNHDQLTSPADAFLLADTIPHACSMGLGCAHLSPIDAFPFFNQGVATFLSTGSL